MRRRRAEEAFGEERDASDARAIQPSSITVAQAATMLHATGAPTAANPTAAALRGIGRATGQVDDAARRIVAAGAPAREAAQPALMPAMEREPDMARAGIDLLAARRAYQASATMLGAADEMQEELLRATA